MASRVWEHLNSQFELDRLRRYVEHGEGKTELVFQIPVEASAAKTAESSWSRVILDGQSGGRPIVVEEWFRTPGKAVPVVNWTTRTAWENRDGFWLPLNWTTEFPGSVKADLTFEWERVGTSIDEVEFSLSHVKLPQGTLVWDHRLGQPVLREKVGAAPVPRRPATELGPGPASPLRTGLLIANAVLLVAIALAAVFYRKRPVRSSDR